MYIHVCISIYIDIDTDIDIDIDIDIAPLASGNRPKEAPLLLMRHPSVADERHLCC